MEPEDVTIQSYSGMSSGVRVTHNPTGITVECSKWLARFKNRDEALAELARKVSELENRRSALKGE